MRQLRLAAWLILMAACSGDRKTESSPRASGLDQLVDSVMPRLQVLAGLPKRGDIQMQLQGRDSLRKYLEVRMNEELPAVELEGIRATYVTLGLLPAELDLQRLLLDLYTEQVVGYYDPVSKKLFVVEDAQPDLLRPTVVHELVHALQDQHTNLDSLISRERGNDRQTAAQAAIEGHATMVMVAFMAEQQAHSPLDPRTLPDIGAAIRPSMEQQNSQFPIFRTAPRILRETLLFPYVSGAGFVQKLWVRPLETGFGEPYPAPLGERLPQSTEQIMHPESRFLVSRDEPTDLAIEPGAGRTTRENTLGELETAIWLSEHLGEDAARFAQGWDGDRYRLLAGSTDAAGSHPVLVWYSVWDDEAAANAFADAARRIAQKRGRASRVERISLNEQPVVRVIDADPGTDLAAIKVPGASIISASR